MACWEYAKPKYDHLPTKRFFLTLNLYVWVKTSTVKSTILELRLFFCKKFGRYTPHPISKRVEDTCCFTLNEIEYLKKETKSLNGFFLFCLIEKSQHYFDQNFFSSNISSFSCSQRIFIPFVFFFFSSFSTCWATRWSRFGIGSQIQSSFGSPFSPSFLHPSSFLLSPSDVSMPWHCLGNRNPKGAKLRISQTTKSHFSKEERQWQQINFISKCSRWNSVFI